MLDRYMDLAREPSRLFTTAPKEDLTRADSKGKHTRTRFFPVCVIPSTRCGEVSRLETGNSGSDYVVLPDPRWIQLATVKATGKASTCESWKSFPRKTVA